MDYKKEGLRRMKIRKKARQKKFQEKIDFKEKVKNGGCPLCGEKSYPYCYCEYEHHLF